MKHKFERDPEGRLMLVPTLIDERYSLKMILDTGASNTTIDSNMLYLLGYNLSDSIGVVEIETANGIVNTEVFEFDAFEALGIKKRGFQIQVYDFIAHGIMSDYNGLLGLDFLEGTNFCINTVDDEIEIH